MSKVSGNHSKRSGKIEHFDFLIEKRKNATKTRAVDLSVFFSMLFCCRFRSFFVLFLAWLRLSKSYYERFVEQFVNSRFINLFQIFVFIYAFIWLCFYVLTYTLSDALVHIYFIHVGYQRLCNEFHVELMWHTIKSFDDMICAYKQENESNKLQNAIDINGVSATFYHASFSCC